MDKLLAALFIGVLTYVLAAIVCLIGAVPAYFLWNWLMPKIFGLKAVTFWQAWGLVWLASILFHTHVSTSKKD